MSGQPACQILSSGSGSDSGSSGGSPQTWSPPTPPGSGGGDSPPGGNGSGGGRGGSINLVGVIVGPVLASVVIVGTILGLLGRKRLRSSEEPGEGEKDGPPAAMDAAASDSPASLTMSPSGSPSAPGREAVQPGTLNVGRSLTTSHHASQLSHGGSPPMAIQVRHNLTNLPPDHQLCVSK